jgi:hypothetical protein
MGHPNRHSRRFLKLTVFHKVAGVVETGTEKMADDDNEPMDVDDEEEEQEDDEEQEEDAPGGKMTDVSLTHLVQVGQEGPCRFGYGEKYPEEMMR